MDGVKNLWSVLVGYPFWICVAVISHTIDTLRFLTRCVTGHKKAVTYGDAAFASERELKRFSVGGFMPGVSEKGRRVYLDEESSAVIFGIRGAGKTQTFIANLKALKGRTVKPDLIVADPVGDIEAAVSEDLHKAGYGKLRLDLTNPRRSDRYDPFSFLKPDIPFDFPRDVMTLCELMLPQGGRENDAGLHFLESARAMLQSMVMWRDQKPEEGDSMGAVVLRLLVEKKQREKEFEAMQKAGGHPLVRQGVEAFTAAGDRERGSMDSTLARKLRPFLDDAVRHITTLDKDDAGWSFEDVFMASKPVVVFIRSGLGNEEFGGPLVRMVVGNAINTARRLWNQTGKPLPKGLWLFVDEAKSMGNCKAIVDAVNELRKARVNCYLAWPTYADVKEVYSSPQSLLNGCAWVVNGGSRDVQLYREIEHLAGTHTIQTRSETKGAYDSESKSETGRPLVTVADLQKLGRDEVVVVAPNLLAKLRKPFEIKNGKVRYP